MGWRPAGLPAVFAGVLGLAAGCGGASHRRMFSTIALPLCRPALVVVFPCELKASWMIVVFLALQRYFLSGIVTRQQR